MRRGSKSHSSPTKVPIRIRPYPLPAHVSLVSSEWHSSRLSPLTCPSLSHEFKALDSTIHIKSKRSRPFISKRNCTEFVRPPPADRRKIRTRRRPYKMKKWTWGLELHYSCLNSTKERSHHCCHLAAGTCRHAASIPCKHTRNMVLQRARF